MSNNEPQALSTAVTALVEEILQRGRLHQLEKEGKLGVKDGGIGLARVRFANQILTLAQTEAVSLAKQLIGKEHEVKESYMDPNDEEKVQDKGDVAIVEFQKAQLAALENYQNPPEVIIAVAPQEEPEDPNRVDRTKPTVELENLTGREENSLNEE